MQLLIDLTFLLLAAGGGAMAVACVRLLRAGESPAGDEPDARFASETLARLHELTCRVAAEVDQHAECMQEINAQLASDDNDEAAVVAAVKQLIDANHRMQQQLDSAEQRLETQARQIESHAAEARTDPLTQVANRRALDDKLARCLAEFQQHGTPTTVMLVDVDHFKRFNDTHGHQAGDDALRTVARVLRQSVGNSGLVARYGGEEFAVVLPGIAAANCAAICERSRQAVAATSLQISQRELRVTVSSGVAELLPGETEKETLIRTDEALYASKRAGRNCGHLHDGRTSRLLRYQEPPPLAATPADGVGDEWLETEIATDSLFREPLPNVASRPAFFDDLIRRLSQWRRSGTPLTVLLVQVDAYQRVLGDHGGAAAEILLRAAAQLVNASMRDMDHLARLSENTFALLLPGAMLADGRTIAEHLRQGAQRCRLPASTGAGRFSLSIGAVQASEGDDLRRVLQRARTALAAAVNAGRNRVVAHDIRGKNLSEPKSTAARFSASPPPQPNAAAQPTGTSQPTRC
ncbi:MAG: diguanylate cyclase [Pirellulales bacterium]|nr:diguanylate cyclase [Pirellulales bacterium]